MPGATRTTTRPDDGWKLLLAAVLLVGGVVAIVGESISAAGAPEIGVVDDWGRIDEAVSQIATWPYVLVVASAAMLVLGGPISGGVDLASSRLARVAWVAALVEFTAIGLAAVVGMVAVFLRQSDADAVGGVGVSDYYPETEKIGETVVYAAIVLVVVALIVVVARARTRDVPSGS